MADGRGRPVLLIPGFLAGDGSLSMMAGWLKRTGYRPSRAGIVSNVNCAGVLLPRLEERLERLVELQGKRAAVVGPEPRRHAREGARAGGGRTSSSGVVALGSPQVDPLAVHPLVRLQVEAVGRLGSLGRARPLQALLHRRRLLRLVLGGPGGAARRGACRSCRSTRRATAWSTGAPASTRTRPSSSRSAPPTAAWRSRDPRGARWPRRSRASGRRRAAPSASGAAQVHRLPRAA